MSCIIVQMPPHATLLPRQRDDFLARSKAETQRARASFRRQLKGEDRVVDVVIPRRYGLTTLLVETVIRAAKRLRSNDDNVVSFVCMTKKQIKFVTTALWWEASEKGMAFEFNPEFMLASTRITNKKGFKTYIRVMTLADARKKCTRSSARKYCALSSLVLVDDIASDCFNMKWAPSAKRIVLGSSAPLSREQPASLD